MIHVAVSREGRRAWIEETGGNNADRAVWVEGVSLVAHRAVNWCRIEGDAVVWSDQAAGRVWGCRQGYAAEMLQLATATELRGVPIPTPEGLWVLTQTHTELRLAPWGSSLGP